MSKKKIVLQTNAPFLKTGLGQNGRCLMKHLLKTGKYDLVYYCTNQVFAHDPNLGRLPCKAYGAIPNDQNVIARMNQDQGFGREVSYGAYFIDQIIKDEKPDIWWGSDDVWGFNGYSDKPWFKEISSIYHITVDSVPVLSQAYQQAKASPHFFTWAKFAQKEMQRVDPSLKHIRTIYGMADVSHFAPISQKERDDLRARFGLDKDAVIFNITNRNQLRKSFPTIIEAFAQFKKEYPHRKAKLHFHTSYAEKHQGWDIPMWTKYYDLKEEDILCTYVCKLCGNWHVAPYKGEDVDCPYCGGKVIVNGQQMGPMITASTNHGVPDEEMKYMYGVSNASISCFTSGGLEFHNVSSLLCGLPTGISTYSCGEDFMDLPFVTPIGWQAYHEQGTNFRKASINTQDIKAFIAKVCKMTDSEKQAIGEAGRDWAAKTFSIDSIGKQWEDVFDALPHRDWSSITLEYKPKNVNFPFPTNSDNESWVKSLYNNILLVEPDPEGFKYWLNALAGGMKREDIYRYFIGRGQEDNAKNTKPVDFGDQFDKNGKKRMLFVIKESGGDVFITTSLFKELKNLYPDVDLYVACDPAFADILGGNEYIHKVLPYQPIMDQEMLMKEHVDHYYFPAVSTQRFLNYLTHDKIGMETSA